MSDRSAAVHAANVQPHERLDAAALEALARLLKAFSGPGGEAYGLQQDDKGRLIVLTPAGERLVFAGTEPLVEALAGRLPAFAEELRMQQVDVDRVLAAMERQHVDLRSWNGIVFQLDRLLADTVPQDGSLSWRSLSSRNEGQTIAPFDAGKIGRGIGHLPPLPGEDMLFADGSRRLVELARIDAPDTDPRTESVTEALKLGGVGAGLMHLPPMPDGARLVIVDRRESALESRRVVSRQESPAQPPEPRPDSYRMAEDGRITGNVLENDQLPNGHQDLRVETPPATGRLELRPDGSFTYEPAAHVSGEVRFTYSFVDGRTGQRVAAVATIDVVPVADAPLLTVPGPLGTDEDQPVTLAGLSGRLVDRDGSETESYTLSNVPAGASFGGKGLNLGNGVWSFTAAELAGPLVFTPPPNSHGVFTLTLTGTARETANGDTARTSLPFTITVAAEADAPSLTSGTTRFNEDTAGLFGPNITYALADTDGSEVISAVALSGFPAGVTVTYAAAPGANVATSGGTYTITGTQSAIRATLDSFRAQQASNKDADFTITVAVTARDADGSTVTTNGTHRLAVDAVADAPTVSGGTSGNEDGGAIPVPVTVALVDTDGSETLTRVDIGNVPTGAVLGWNTGLPGTVTSLGSGVFRFEGTQAQIQALLASLTLTPPAHSDADIALSVAATVTETNPSESGGVAQLTATRNATVTVALTAVADAPVVTAPGVAGEEDTALAFGAALTITKPDNDGSESIDRVTIANLPAGWTLGWNTGLAGTVTPTADGAVITGSEAEIRALLASMTATPPLHSDADATISITVRTRDNDGSTANTTVTQALTVDAQADAPTTSVTTQTVNEDGSVIAGPGISWTKPDNDGSEWVSRVEITGLPVGWSAGFTGQAGVTVTGDAQSGFVVSIAAKANEAALRSVINSFTVTPPANSDVDANIRIRTTTTDADGSTSTGAYSDMLIAVAPVSDQPTVGTSSPIVVEDQFITFGPSISFTTPDVDGSERVSRVEITGFGASTVTWTLIGTASIVAIPGGYALTAANEVDLRATLDTLALRPPAHSDADIVLTVRAQTTDGVAVPSSFGVNTMAVTVTPAADAPGASVGTGAFTTPEDTAIALTGLAGTLVDADGSESLSYRITGVPNGTSFNLGTNLGGGVWAFTQAQITAGLTLTPPTNYAGTMALTLQVTSTEADGGASAMTSLPFTVEVGDAADPPSVPATNSSGDEDNAIAFGANVTYALTDTDGSEVISQVAITNVPVGAVVAYVTAPGATVTAIAGGYTITGSQTAIRTTLDSFSLTPPANSDANIALTIAVTSRETGGATTTTTATHGITVNARADAPLVSGSASGNEDSAISAPVTVTLGDTDGSETLAFVEVSGLPPGVVLGWNTGLPGSVTTPVAGTWRFTGTTPQIQALLASLTVTPPAHSDAEFSFNVLARSIESNPSQVGEVSLLTRDTSFTVPVTVTAVADKPGLSVGAISGNEDSPITFGNAITWSKPDTDGSEWISQVTLTGFPPGWTVSYMPDAAVTIMGDAQSGYTLSIAAKADEAKLRAVLNTFAVQGPAESDADATIQARVTTTDNDGSTSQSDPVNVAVVVAAVADMPSASAQNATGDEDTWIPLTLSTGLSPDADGSETLSVRITGVPTGASFSAGTNLGGNVWSFTAAQLVGLQFRGPSQLHGPQNMTLIARSTESSNGDFREATSPFTITLNSVLDPIDLTNSAQTVNEDAAINVGAQFGISLVDLDGSQNLSYTISGIPAGYTVGRTLQGATSYTDLGGGSVRFSGTNANDVINSVRTMTLTPGGVAQHKDANFTLSLSASTAENSGGGTSSDTATHAVTVRAVADVPTVSSTHTATINEDPVGGIAFPVTATLVDTDGSEVISQVDVTFTSWTGTRPTLNWNTGLPGTVSSITNGHRFTGTTAQIQALLASLTITPQTHNGSDFSVRVVATSRESNPTEVGDVATLTATRTQNYSFNTVPVADQPNATAPGVGSPFLTEEDTNIQITGLDGSLVDTDLSEMLSFQIRNVPVGASFTTGTNLGGGVWSFTPLQIAIGPIFVPPPGTHGSYDLTLRAIATETENNSTAFTDAVFRIIVDAQADTPTVSGSSTVTEDVATTIGGNIAYGLTDNDGSEYVDRITLSGLPAGWVATFPTTHPNVTITGDAQSVSRCRSAAAPMLQTCATS